MSNNDEEVDLFELSANAVPPAPLSGAGRDARPFETETNVFSIEFDKATGPKIVTPPAAPIAPARVPAPPPAFSEKTASFDLDDIDFEDEMPKQGFFGKLFGKKKAFDDFDDDFDDIPVKKRKGNKGFDDDDFGEADFDVSVPKKAESPAPLQTPAPVQTPAASAPIQPASIADDDVFDLSALPPAVASSPIPKTPAPAVLAHVPKAPAPMPIPAPQPKASIPIPASIPAPAPAPQSAPPSPDNASPPMFRRIAHVCLFVRDLEASVKYYTALGMRQRFAFNKKGSVYGVYMEFGEGGNFIELFEDPIQAISPNGRLAHFCLETPDIDAAAAYLTSRGIRFTPKKFGCDATYQIWLKDPDGNDFEIHQYTPKSSQLIGGDVEVDW